MSIGTIQRQSLITFSSMIALTAIGFLSTIYFAHSLGPAVLGGYFLFLAYFGIFNLIGDGGFGGAAVKRISEGREPHEYFSAFVFIRIALLAASITAILWAEPLLIDITSSGLFFWLIISLIISVFSTCAGIGVYSSGHVGVNQISNFLDAIIRTGFQVIAVFAGFGIAGLAGGFVVGMIAGGLANYKYLDLNLVPFTLKHLKNLTSFSFWIFLSSSGSLVFCYADTILIGFFMSNAEVGVYRTAFQLTSVATFTTMAFHTVLYPRISNWEARGQMEEIRNSLARAFTYSLFLAIPACVGGWILGDRLLYFLYGASFTLGTQALYFLLLAQVANVFMYLGTMSLNALSHQKDTFRITVTTAAINVILDIALIPVLGITGAAVATLTSMVLNGVTVLLILNRIIPLKFEYKALENILSASGCMVLFLVVVHFLVPLMHIASVLAVVVAGAGIYLAVLFSLDRELFQELKKLSTDLGIPWP